MDSWIESLGADPLAALAAWLEEARAAGLHEPEAAALATATPDARPSVRMVLVRGIAEGDAAAALRQWDMARDPLSHFDPFITQGQRENLCG